MKKERHKIYCERHKLWYKTIEKAWYGAYGIWKKYGTETSPYKCPYCKFFHLTSREEDVPDWLVTIMRQDLKGKKLST